MQRPEDILDDTQRQCNHLANHFYFLMRPFRIHVFKSMDANSMSTWSIAERIEGDTSTSHGVLLNGLKVTRQHHMEYC